MADKSIRYTQELKRHIVELVRSGRSPTALSKEFGPTAWTIAIWVRQNARDAHNGDGGLTSVEQKEFANLRLENRKIREEREILLKATAWFGPHAGIPKRRSD
jgi:transposase